MMGRRRKSHKNLPPRVYVHHGSYRYVPKVGRAVTLARVGDWGGMYRALAKSKDAPESALGTLGALMDRYLRDMTPGKNAVSRRTEPRQMARLRAVFGHMSPADLEQAHAYAYLDKRSQKAPVAARREIELLRHVCTKAVRWGALRANPLRGMELPPVASRRHYVTDATYRAAWNQAAPIVRGAMDIAILTGLRRGDILALTRSNLTDDGLLVRTSKTGAEILFEWTPTLRQVLRDVLSEPPQVRQAIICTKQGTPYSDSGFGNAWNKLQRRLEAAGHERFQFKDLRKKSASDEIDAAVASNRLGHTSQAITDRVYRIRPRIVRPLR